MASEYSLSEPETVDLPVTENRFVYIEGTGAFSTMAPAMWDEFNAQIRPKIPGADSGENWSAARGDSPGNGHYRCGVLLSAPLAPGTALPGDAKLGSIPDGKYAKFVLKGSLDHMTEAYMKAYEAIKKHDLLKIRQGTECVETYLTDFKTTPPAQQQTAIFLPVDVPSGKYTMTGPERRHLAPTPHRYLHLSGHGASIEEINPGNLWMKFHGEVLPHVPEAQKEGVTMWATANTNVKGKGSAVYRCGALLPKPAEKSHVVPKGSHAHLSNLPDGDYVVFEMTGWFDCLAEAYPEALRRAKEAGFVVMEHEDFLETYLTNPMSTAYNDNKTDIYLPVELQSPTRKHRVETSG